MANALSSTFGIVCLLWACGGSQAPALPEKRPAPSAAVSEAAPVFALAEQAGAGVENPELRRLLVDHWDWNMMTNPVWATTLGDHRFDDRLDDNSREAVAAQRAKLRDLLQRAVALESSARLGDDDRTTLALFRDELDSRIRTQVCEDYTWNVSARGNPVVDANVLPEDHVLTDVESGRKLLARYKQIAGTVETNIANLDAGLAAKRVANAETLRRTAALVRGQLETPLEDWALLKPMARVASLEGWAEEDRERFRSELRATVEGPVKDSFARYLEFLETRLIPEARTGDRIGAHALPDGDACYEAKIRYFISLDKTAEEIHALGLAEIERINGEMMALGRKLFKTRTLAKTIERLRTDKSLYYQDAKDIVAKAESSLARAKAAIGQHFGILPSADCEVVEIPAYEAPYTTIAYYRGPHQGNDKPGEYFINTYKPEVRPRFEMEVLAYHEAIPGHHLQIAIAQERGELPAFRRFGGSTAFVEGWALYTERLSEEMGLYSGDLDRMGMLSYDAWRASRLVVDTGIHAKGWTREQAEAFMREHTALTEENIKNEVDRYISWPGQALAYKVGQLEILSLRAAAQEKLGKLFDIKGFHDAVLSKGAVTLPVLAQQVEAWVARTAAENTHSAAEQ